MIVLKIALTLCASILGIHADVGPGQNGYLPPDKGYQYPKPSRPFETPTRPSRPTFPTPQPGYTPAPTRPPPFPTSRPTYGPPPVTSTPYRPPSLTPTRPGPTIPTYRPTTPGYRPSPTPGYRPSPTPVRPRPTPGYEPSPSDRNGVHEQAHEHHHHHEPGMPFDFAYAVNDAEHGNDYSHNAISDGDITRGEYRIVLPDGRTQVVKYTADWKNGFNAQVSFEGNPTYPQFQGAGSSPQGGGYKY